jgi:hypothetical protein
MLLRDTGSHFLRRLAESKHYTVMTMKNILNMTEYSSVVKESNAF